MHIARVSEAFPSCGCTDRLVSGDLMTPSEDSCVKIPSCSGQTFSWLLRLHTRLAAQDGRQRSDSALAVHSGTWRQGRYQEPVIPRGKKQAGMQINLEQLGGSPLKDLDTALSACSGKPMPGSFN